jgi:tryptophan 2,3-dioxygenase
METLQATVNVGRSSQPNYLLQGSMAHTRYLLLDQLRHLWSPTQAKATSILFIICIHEIASLTVQTALNSNKEVTTKYKQFKSDY